MCENGLGWIAGILGQEDWAEFRKYEKIQKYLYACNEGNIGENKES